MEIFSKVKTTRLLNFADVFDSLTTVRGCKKKRVNRDRCLISDKVQVFRMADAGGFIDNNSFESFGQVENRWRIKHPVVTFFHLLFRTLALIGKYQPIINSSEIKLYISLSVVWMVLKQFHR